MLEKGLKGGYRFDAGAQHSVRAKTSRTSQTVHRTGEAAGAKSTLEIWLKASRHTHAYTHS